MKARHANPWAVLLLPWVALLVLLYLMGCAVFGAVQGLAAWWRGDWEKR